MCLAYPVTGTLFFLCVANGSIPPIIGRIREIRRCIVIFLGLKCNFFLKMFGS